MLNVTEYFRTLIAKNKLAQEKNVLFTTASSLYSLEDVAYHLGDRENFFVMIETTSGTTELRRGGGYFLDKQYNAALLMRFEVGNESDRLEKLNTMRELQRQILSYMIREADRFEEQQLQYFDTSRTLVMEYPEFQFAGLEMLVFQFNIDEPECLSYSAEDWDEEDDD